MKKSDPGKTAASPPSEPALPATSSNRFVINITKKPYPEIMDIIDTIIHRSGKAQSAELSRLIKLLIVQSDRYDALRILGARDERQAKGIAAKHTTRETYKSLTEMMQRIETYKGRKYATLRIEGARDLQSYFGIPHELLSQKITVAESEELEQRLKCSTFNNFNAFQNLPRFDEAYNLFLLVRHDLSDKTTRSKAILKAETLPISDDDIKSCAENGFWEAMPLPLKRRAYQLLPIKKRKHIAAQHKEDKQAAMDATRSQYDKLIKNAS